MATRLSDVAARAGVSVKTVSNVINDYPHITAHTRAKVEAAIADLDYRPNVSARSLRKGRSDFIALAIPEMASPYFAELGAAISPGRQEARDHRADRADRGRAGRRAAGPRRDARPADRRHRLLTDHQFTGEDQRGGRERQAADPAR